MNKMFGKLFYSKSEVTITSTEEIKEPEEDFSMYIKPKGVILKQENLQNKLHPIIHWDPQKVITYLEPLTFHQHFIAYCKDYKARNVDGNFIFNPPEGTVLPAGDHELTVTFIPIKTYKYLSAFATRPIKILKRKPHVYWNNPHFIHSYTPSFDATIVDNTNTVLVEAIAAAVAAASVDETSNDTKGTAFTCLKTYTTVVFT